MPQLFQTSLSAISRESPARAGFNPIARCEASYDVAHTANSFVSVPSGNTMARPRKLAQDDRYVEETLIAHQEQYPHLDENEDEDGVLELGLASRSDRFAALREQDFGDDRS